MSASQYRVGIDLGTTNSVVSYLEAGMTEPALLMIPQVMSDGSVQAFTSLPSALYLLAQDEINKLPNDLPWQQSEKAYILGYGALALGQRRANQLVQSAKSWLSHRQVDRRSKILPWGSDIENKMSPLAASQAILEHIRQSWNHAFPQAPLEHQQVALTLPASFDEEARALTLEAAKLAGLDNLYLLEEPQAACYHYINSQTNLQALASKKMLLVVDVGGGTSDFSLVAIQPAEQGKVALKRIAVGDHLLLGGDNLDQALAFQLDPKQISALSASRLAALVQQTRQAKETLLSNEAPDHVNITLLGGGKRLIGGAQKFTVAREQLIEQVEQGFFPVEPLSSTPQQQNYAVHTLGLAYESDPAFSRHLAAFLSRHKELIEQATGTAMPDAILFNGGLFNSPLLKQRLLDQVNHWATSPLLECHANEPNHAVAKGAACYLSALAGEGQHIESGVPHSLFLQLAEEQFVCILPKGSLTGEILTLEQDFMVTLGQEVQFPLYRSDDHIVARTGEVFAAEGMHYISTLATELDGQHDTTEMAVKLTSQITEVGVLQLDLVASQTSAWRLDFSTKPQKAEAESSEGVLAAKMGEAEEHLARCFSQAGQKQSPELVKSLKQDLDQLLGSREAWSLATSRRIVDKLLALKAGRNKSAQHERQWLQLLGYCLRPGYGAQGDEQRVQQVVNLTKAGTQFDTAAVWGQYWTLYRRIAGGLSSAQQAQLFKEFSQFYSPAGQRSREKMKALTTRSSDDLIRLMGALEALPQEDKLTITEWLLKRLKKSSEPDTAWWTIGRIASRHLLSGQPEQRIAESNVEEMIQLALKEDWKKRKQAGLAAVLMTQVSFGEAIIWSSYRQQVAKKLTKDKCPNQWTERLQSQAEISNEELNALVGESLPIGLRLSTDM